MINFKKIFLAGAMSGFLIGSGVRAMNQCVLDGNLWIATENGNLPEMEKLINAGANIYNDNDINFMDIHSVLAYACSNGQVAAVDLLLEKCKFTLADIKESFQQLDKFTQTLTFCCDNEPTNFKCANCLEKRKKVGDIFIMLSRTQEQLQTYK
jgi:ankyrin repeat protein